MIVRDEEERLPRCLESLSGLVDEIALVDTGSKDRTVEIAREAGARVLCEEWRDDFAFHRNQSIELATGRWCLIIDADEEVCGGDLHSTRWHLEHDSLPPLMMVSVGLSYPDGKRLEMLVPRLMQKDVGIRYVHAVHEQLDIGECSAGLSNIRIEHHGYAVAAELGRKERRNLSIAEAMADGPHAWHCRARAAMSLRDWPKVIGASRKLTLDGTSPVLRLEGCILGGVAACYASDDGQLAEFVRMAADTGLESPDRYLLELLLAARRYQAILAEGDSRSPGTFLRPWSYWHDRGQADLIVEVLLGRRRLAPGVAGPT
jgi:hypothetical protein